MKHILVSGLVNVETTARVRQFPVEYYPIDYPYFGVNTAVSGVGYNIAGALTALGDSVTLTSITGQDFPAAYIRQELAEKGISSHHLKPLMEQTANSVVLYDETGKRQIYCDLKDIQKRAYGFPADICTGVDLVAACNINFNRPLLYLAKEAGKTIATDVHVLSSVEDDYNREFMECADILFLSDEALGEDWRSFLWALAERYGCAGIVLGRGSRGAAMYVRAENRIYELPAARIGQVVNTVGAGDALFSAFLHSWAKGRDPLEALIRAELFAAAKIRISGAAKGFVSEETLEELYGRYSGALWAAVRG